MSGKPVVMGPESPDHGGARVSQYFDSDTGAYMYRVEKESNPINEEAEQVVRHCSAKFAMHLLRDMQDEWGGKLGAKGCMLLIDPNE